MSLSRSSLKTPTLRELLVKRASGFSKQIIGLMIGLTLVLQVAVLIGEHSDTRQQILVWLEKNQQRIEQALFLQNTLGVDGMLRESGDLGRIGHISIYSIANTKIAEFGSENSLCSEKASLGFQTSLTSTALCYRNTLSFADQRHGSIVIEAKYDLWGLATNLSLCAALSLLIFFILRWSAKLFIGDIQNFVISPLSAMVDIMGERAQNISEITAIDETHDQFKSASDEVKELIKTYNGLIEMIRALNIKDRERVELLSYGQVAAQVSHDIRSPLTALKMASAKLDDVEESRKVLIRSAIQRIDEISRTLHEKSTEAKSVFSETSARPTRSRPEAITDLVENLAMEKRAEYANFPALKFVCNIEAGFGLFSEIDSSLFKRNLSNIINNAVEATNGTGEIKIIVSGNESFVLISVEDSGSGIPSAVLKQLGRKIISFGKDGKKSGQGIGVLKARQFAEQAGGELMISSHVGKGTVVTFLLPRSATPEWFLNALEIEGEKNIVMVDDDPSIHEVWKSRIQSSGVDMSLIKFVSHYDPQSFLKWLKEADSNDSSNLYLIDYEFRGTTETGLDLIEKIPNPRFNAVLISSRADEEFVQKRLRAKGLRFLPKSLAHHVPIIWH